MIGVTAREIGGLGASSEPLASVFSGRGPAGLRRDREGVARPETSVRAAALRSPDRP